MPCLLPRRASLLLLILYTAPLRADFTAHHTALDIGQLIEDCQAALQEDEPKAAVADILRRALADPAAAKLALGEPNQSGYEPIFRSATLTIVNAGWRPGLSLPPHNHGLWSVTAVYTGAEHNTLWRDQGGELSVQSELLLEPGDVLPLSADEIHSVRNLGSSYTGALQVFGGDFLSARFQRWDPETQEPETTDGEAERLRFVRDNEQHRP